MGFYSAIAAAGAAIIAVTAWITASEYGNLPDRVPTQFWVDGKPTAFGPRPMIWLTVGVQVLCAGIFVFTGHLIYSDPKTRDHTLSMALFGLCVTSMVAYVQTMIIQAAKLPEPRLPMKRYWLAFIGFMAAAIVCVLVSS